MSLADDLLKPLLFRSITPEWALADWLWEPVGSRVTCNPPPSDTDEDFLVYADDFDGARLHLAALGFAEEGDRRQYEEMSEFLSLRRGKTNVILAEDFAFYDHFLCASNLAKRFNLLRKEDRIALFQGVLYRRCEETR